MKQTLRYQIETLSPLHIGNGQEYGVFDGVFWNGRWYLMDIDKVVAHSGVEASALANAMMQQGFNWAGWLQKHKIAVDSVAKRSVPCAQNPEQTKIRACLRDPYERPYIPGSTLKGAIRTALLEAVVNELNERESQRLARQTLQRDRNNRLPDRRYVARRVLEKELLVGKNARIRHDVDPNHDLLRALHVADSDPVAPEQVEIGLVWTYTIRNNALVQKRAGGEEYKMFAEWLPEGVQSTLTITIDQHLLSGSVRSQLGFKEDKAALITAFARHCNERTRLLIESEREFYDHYALNALKEFYEGLEKRLGSITQAGGLVLNIGWGGGWEMKTVLNPLTDGLDDEYDQIRHAYQLGRRNSEFPKTRRVAFRDGEPYAPLGWIALTPLRQEI